MFQKSWLSVLALSAFACAETLPAPPATDRDDATETPSATQPPADCDDLEPSGVEATVEAQLAALTTGGATSVQLVCEAMRVLDARPELNAVPVVWAAESLEAARQADAARAAGETTPLLGVPVVVKDNIDVAGTPTTGGTPGLADNIAPADAPVVRALREAGAVVMGKANLHELASGATGLDSAFGPTLHPANPELFPGGSSSGSAVAVASGAFGMSLGSDTAGSIRIPAALTGVVGFRPSLGRYATDGVIPLASSRDTVGPLAHTVRDVAIVDAVLTGDDVPPPTVDLREVRIGLPGPVFYAGLHGEVDRGVQRALDALAEAGAQLVVADVPEMVSDLDEAVFFGMALYEGQQELAAYLEQRPSAPSLPGLVEQIQSPGTRGFFELMLSPAAGDEASYAAASGARVALQDLLDGYFAVNELDAMLYPTTPLPARRVADASPPEGMLGTPIELDGEVVTDFLYVRNASVASSADLPAITLPAGLTADGLPFGIEIAGPAGADRELLGIAEAIEAVLAVE
ncbi:MAG: amidase family protein [Myxococcota bacterium]